MEALKKTSESTSPSIYVACLAAYNAGKLHGVWIDLAGKDASDIWAEVEAMLAASPIPDAEEWAIHDYEGFGGIKLSESEDLDDLPELVEAIEENPESYPIYVGLVGAAYATPDGFAECYQGAWDSPRDYAEQWAEDCGLLADAPEFLARHIDWDSVVSEMKTDGYYFSEDGGPCHVFSNY